jgi:hypothetical protein
VATQDGVIHVKATRLTAFADAAMELRSPSIWLGLDSCQHFSIPHNRRRKRFLFIPIPAFGRHSAESLLGNVFPLLFLKALNLMESPLVLSDLCLQFVDFCSSPS